MCIRDRGKNEQLAKVDLSKVHATDGVVVEGFDNTPIKFAKCCSPLPGDPIVGFITRGFGVSIHKQSCVNAISSIDVYKRQPSSCCTPTTMCRASRAKMQRPSAGTSRASCTP